MAARDDASLLDQTEQTFGDMDYNIQQDDPYEHDSGMHNIEFDRSQSFGDGQRSGGDVVNWPSGPPPGSPVGGSWQGMASSETEHSLSQADSVAYSQGRTSSMEKLERAAANCGGSGGLLLQEYIAGLAELPTRLQAARAFHDVLYMVSKDVLNVKQNRAFGRIFVRTASAAA